MGHEDVHEGLEGLVEYDFVVLTGMNGARLGCYLWRWYLWVGASSCGPRVEFEVVVENELLFTSLWDEVDSDLNLELSPSEDSFSMTIDKEPYNMLLTLFLSPQMAACRRLSQPKSASVDEQTEGRTSCRIRICLVKFEGHPLYEVTYIICSSYNI